MTLITAKTRRRTLTIQSFDLFSLAVKHTVFQTKIDMTCRMNIVNTRDIPWTYDFLAQNLPSILSSTCFNDEQLPFSVEVTRTELGHLFEHMLLEYLCEEKLKNGCDEAVFSGRTNWNWEIEPYGVFHIAIDMNIKDRDYFNLALPKTITLFQNMLQNKTKATSLYPLISLKQTQSPTVTH